MNNKKRVTLRLSKDLATRMRNAMAEDDYGVRDKAKWVSEAIISLLESDDYYELVDLEENTGVKNDNPEGFYLTRDLKTRLDKAIIICRTNLPHLGNIQSAIIRTAIKQRLLRRINL